MSLISKLIVKVWESADSFQYFFTYLFLTALFVASTISNYGSPSLILKFSLALVSTFAIVSVAGRGLTLRPDGIAGWLLLSLPIYIALSLLWSANHYFGSLKLFHLLTLFIPFYLFVNNLETLSNYKSFVNWGTIAIGAGIVLSLWVIVGEPIDLAEGYRSVSIPFTGRIVTYVSVFVIFLIYIRLAGKKSYTVLLLLTIGLSVISFRAGIIVVVVISLLVSVMYALRKEFALGFLCIGTIIIGVLIGSLISGNLDYRTVWVAEAVSGKSIGDISVSVRIDAIKLSFLMWLDAPLLGLGVGGFNDVNFPDSLQSIMKYPHNVIMEILSEYGMVGGLLFLVTFAAFFVKTNFSGMKNITPADPRIGIILLLVTAMILSLFSKDMSHNIIVYLIGYALYKSSHHPKNVTG